MEEQIKQLVKEELKRAREKFPRNQSSAHEGYAVLLEEVEEMKHGFETLNRKLSDLWQAIKINETPAQKAVSLTMLITANDLIKESVQVAAMIKRFQQDILEYYPTK